MIASAAGVELAGVVTRSPDRRAELERDHPGTPAFDSLAELAGRRGRRLDARRCLAAHPSARFARGSR
jgi:hypothetical protein